MQFPLTMEMVKVISNSVGKLAPALHVPQSLRANLGVGAAVVLVAEPDMIAQPVVGIARIAGTAPATRIDRMKTPRWHDIPSTHLGTDRTAVDPRRPHPIRHKRR